MTEELYHYGVKGMKWGVRKDRNRSSLKELRKNADLDEVRRLNKGYVYKNDFILSRPDLAVERVANQFLITVGSLAAQSVFLKGFGSETLARVAGYANLGLSMFNAVQGVADQILYRPTLESAQRKESQ